MGLCLHGVIASTLGAFPGSSYDADIALKLTLELSELAHVGPKKEAAGGGQLYAMIMG